MTNNDRASVVTVCVIFALLATFAAWKAGSELVTLSVAVFCAACLHPVFRWSARNYNPKEKD